MGETLTFDARMKETKMKPGPGEYNQDQKGVKTRNAAWSMTQDARVDKNHMKAIMNQTAPGQYSPEK
jgi:hypothetical protein